MLADFVVKLKTMVLCDKQYVITLLVLLSIFTREVVEYV